MPHGNTWCLVFLDKKFWGIVDQHFGSFTVSEDGSEWMLEATDIKGYKQSRRDAREMWFAMDENYFLPDPNQFVYDHLPSESSHQLLARPVTSDEFTQMARLYSPFFEYGIEDINEARCKLINESGRVEFIFRIKPGSLLTFSYVILKHVGPHVKKDVNGQNLNNYVLLQNKQNTKTLDVRFKEIGLYKIQVYVSEVGNDERKCLCDYVVRCNCPYFNLQAYPPVSTELQEIGAGANCHLLKLETDQQSGIILVEEGYAQIQINSEQENIQYFFVLESQLRYSVRELRNALLQDIQSNNAIMLHIKLPQEGDYLLKCYTRVKGGDTAYKLTCNYLLRADMKNLESGIYPADLGGVVGRCNSSPLQPVTHIQSFIRYLNNEEEDDLEIRMKLLARIEVESSVTHYEGKTATDFTQFHWLQQTHQTISIHLRFPKPGTYKLTLFSQDKEKAFELWQYLIEVNMPSKNYFPFPDVNPAWSSLYHLHEPRTGVLMENTPVTFHLQLQGKITISILHSTHLSIYQFIFISQPLMSTIGATLSIKMAVTSIPDNFFLHTVLLFHMYI